MRDRITTALELLGLSSITAGAAMASPALGFVVGGLALFAIGVRAADPALDSDAEDNA